MERDDRYREDDRDNQDEPMKRDRVRGSLDMPSSGKSERPMDRDQGIPEFDRMDDEDRTSER